MRNINTVLLSGTVFFSKLNDKQSYALLNVGLKLANGGAVFVTINNPKVSDYEKIKAGNKLVISSGTLSLWEKEDGTSEVTIKCNDPAAEFFPKEKVIADLNHVTILGRVIDYKDSIVTIETIGERNPKTDKPTLRKVKVNIGDSFGEIKDKEIILNGKITSIDVAGKSKLVVTADYDKITIL